MNRPTDKLSPERKKALERIAKLLALAEGTTFDGEAQAAREAALRLMAEHNVREAEAKAGQPFEIRNIKPYFDEDVWWEREFKWAIAVLNNCYCLLVWGNKERNLVQAHCFVARANDLDAFEYMYFIALRQRTDAWNKYKARGGTDGKAKWLYGYARGVEEKVSEILDEVAARMPRGKNALAPLSLMQQAQEWYRGIYGEPGDLDSLPGSNSTDGQAAGSNVNLYRGEMTAPPQRLGAVRRLSGPQR